MEDSFRPGYPPELVQLLRNGLFSDGKAISALDIAAGTGLFTKSLLEAGYRVTAVDPDLDSLSALQALANTNSRLTVLQGTAERLPVSENSFDLATAAQSFHWFDRGALKKGLRRVLKTGGLFFVAWNRRNFEASEAMNALGSFMKDFSDPDKKKRLEGFSENSVVSFFEGKVDYDAFPHEIRVTYRQLEEFVVSRCGDIFSNAGVERLASLYARFSENGLFPLNFVCKCWWGHVA